MVRKFFSSSEGVAAEERFWTAHRYKAFLSYARADKAAATKFHEMLENFKVPKGLRNIRTPFGHPPRRIAPVFRDLSDLDAHGGLTENIQNALRQSAFLVVMCSPAAAQSRWVNAEIENFISIHDECRIIAVLVDGDPIAYDHKTKPSGAFPPALLKAYRQHGRDEPTAPDIRADAEGFDYAVVKTAAAIIGVTPELLSQRVAQRDRREKHRHQQIAVSMTLLAALTAIASWVAFGKLNQSELRRSIALAGRSQQSFAEEKFDQAALIALAALPDHRAIISGPATRESAFAFRKADYWNRLQALASSDKLLVRALAASPDGSAIAIGDQDGGVKLLNTSDGRELTKIDGHPCPTDNSPNARCSITDIVFHIDGKSFATASFDDTVKIWSAETGELLREIAGHAERRTIRTESSTVRMIEGAVVSLDLSPNGDLLASASWDGTARIWNYHTGEEITRITHGVSPLHNVQFDNTGEYFAATGEDGVAALWSSRDGMLQTNFDFGTQHSSRGLDFSPDGQNVAISYENGSAGIFDLSTGALGYVLSIGGEPKIVRYSPDGERILVAGRSPKMVMFNATTGARMWEAIAHEELVNDAVFSDDGNFLITAGIDGRAIMWRAYDGMKAAVIGNSETSIVDLEALDGGKRIATSGADGVAIWHGFNWRTPRVLSTRNCDNENPLAPGTCWSHHTEYSNDGSLSAILWADGDLALFSHRNGAEMAPPRSLQNPINAFTFASGANALIAPSAGGVQLVELKTGDVKRTWLKNVDSIRSIEISQDGNAAIAIASDQTVWLIDVSSEMAPRRVGERFCKTFFVQQGASVASVNNSGEIELSRTADGGGLNTGKVFPEQCFAGTAHAVSADGNTFAVSIGRSVIVVDANSGEIISKMPARERRINALALSSAGDTLIVGESFTRAIVFIDIKSGQTKRNMETREGMSLFVTDSTGSILYSAGQQTAIDMWDIEAAGYIATQITNGRPTALAVNNDTRMLIAATDTGRVLEMERPALLTGRALAEAGCQNLAPGRQFTQKELEEPTIGGLLTTSELKLCH